jgi:hypothetical protein
MSGGLKIPARNVARADAADLVPGMKVDRLPPTRVVKKKQQAFTENRRRRSASSRD